MLKKIGVFVVLAVLVCSGAAVAAEKGIVDTVKEGCKEELGTFCKDVKPGEGRVLACLYAHGDKISNRCEYAVYDAAAQLERALTALTYVANECKDDLKTHCANVKAGEGRLLDCIEKNASNLTERCKQAFRDVSHKK